MKMILFLFLFLCINFTNAFCWGFYGHGKINYFAVFLLPPEMMCLYKPNIDFLENHSTDPDKRRYAIKEEAPRHYIDMDFYGRYPYPNLPHRWKDAMSKYTEDTLNAHGIVPWHIQVMMLRLTHAFREKDFLSILTNSAAIGHYIADAHVPLHTSSNHNGQLSNQRGIHGFWESRVPELLAEKNFDFFIGKAAYIENPQEFIWNRVMESALAVDSVLLFEKLLSEKFPSDLKYAFEARNGQIIKQYSAAFTQAYNDKLDGMIERIMRQSVFAVASFWYTAWVNAGQPDLRTLNKNVFSHDDLLSLDSLNSFWKSGAGIIGREE
jgi:hypothetical protein